MVRANDRIDDMIVGEVARAGATGITAWEIESALSVQIGPTVHQTVTGNLRHLVERDEIFQLSEMRFVGGTMRHVYLSPSQYSLEKHGRRIVRERRSRKKSDESERIKLRRRVENARPGSVHNRLLVLFKNYSGGLTCRDIERILQISHQTASARLAEAHAAGLVERTGQTRALPNESRRQPVYQLATSQKSIRETQSRLFDEF
jgi:hypothetical protein